MNVITHYDLLIDENNDPFRDPRVLQEYMCQWDGELFLEAMELTKNKSVLEIGIGTGRIAVKVAESWTIFTRKRRRAIATGYVQLVAKDMTRLNF